jgi:hypothetical protein
MPVLVEADHASASRRTMRWSDISPAAATLLWHEVVWFRGLFTTHERLVLERIEAQLAAITARSEITLV